MTVGPILDSLHGYSTVGLSGVKIADVEPSQSFLVGIDTGGTYTDAVAYDVSTATVASKAKVATNHDDLGSSVSVALREVIDGSFVSPEQDDLVSISTTLATNAIVEGSGRPAALISIGFDEAALNRGGLMSALGGDPAISLSGGHSPHGHEAEELDLSSIPTALAENDHLVEAYAVVGAFSVRNPAHERAVAEAVQKATGKPVTCSHELSGQLNGPRRAVTALLNARLISLIHELLTAVETAMDSLSLKAPLMVVRGDGSLVSASFVRQRPIETILSGPAASVLGSSALAEMSDGIIADIGGTTTDIAILEDGTPGSDLRGAIVGGNATMIDAIRVHTEGIGGDSQVRSSPLGGSELSIGPRRAVPLVVAAQSNSRISSMLTAQLEKDVARDTDGAYLWLRDRASRWTPRSDPERQVIQALTDSDFGLPYDMAIRSGLQRNAADRLLAAGVLGMAAFTPTDALHVLGLDARYDPTPAELGAELLARQQDRFGETLADNIAGICKTIYQSVALKIGSTILRAACDWDDLPVDELNKPLALEALERAVSGHKGALAIGLGVDQPVVAVGAAAHSYFPEVVRLLNTDLIVPEHAEVANAFGAATGMIRLSTLVTISAPRRGLFRVHAGDQPKTFYELGGAQQFAETAAGQELEAKMVQAGATSCEITHSWKTTEITVANRPLFVEAVLTSTASGRP